MRQMLIVRGEHSEPEVSYAYLVVRVVFNRINQYILWLYISMYYLLPLQEVQCQQDLLNDHFYIWLLELLVGLQGLKEGPIRLVLQDHIHEIVILEDLKEPDDTDTLLKGPVHLDLIEEEFDPVFYLLDLIFIELFDGYLGGLRGARNLRLLQGRMIVSMCKS